MLCYLFFSKICAGVLRPTAIVASRRGPLGLKQNVQTFSEISQISFSKSPCVYTSPLSEPGSKVLYLGAASGTTVSHVADIVGPEGMVYAVEFSHRSVICENFQAFFRGIMFIDDSHPFILSQSCQSSF